MGKTTIATHFACIAADRGFKTLLIDADLQRSAMLFRQAVAEMVNLFEEVMTWLSSACYPGRCGRVGEVGLAGASKGTGDRFWAGVDLG